MVGHKGFRVQGSGFRGQGSGVRGQGSEKTELAELLHAIECRSKWMGWREVFGGKYPAMGGEKKFGGGG